MLVLWFSRYKILSTRVEAIKWPTLHKKEYHWLTEMIFSGENACPYWQTRTWLTLNKWDTTIYFLCEYFRIRIRNALFILSISPDGLDPTCRTMRHFSFASSSLLFSRVLALVGTKIPSQVRSFLTHITSPLALPSQSCFSNEILETDIADRVMHLNSHLLIIIWGSFCSPCLLSIVILHKGWCLRLRVLFLGPCQLSKPDKLP